MHARTLAATIIGAHLALSAVIAGGIATTARAGSPDLPARAHWMRTLCPEEDSTDCAWNAGAEGNGVGHSFYSVTRHAYGPHGHDLGRVTCVYYVTRIDAGKWDACHLLPAGAPTHP